VGFHLASVAVGNAVYLTYDSVLAINQDKSATRGEVRQAVRSTIYPEDWVYSTLQASANGIAVAGFDVATLPALDTSGIASKVTNAWMAASGIAIPDADQIQWNSSSGAIQSVTPDAFGTPASPLALSSTAILFGCNGRLCAINKADQTIDLVSAGDFTNSEQVAWITIAGKKYALAGVGGKLTLFKSL
jgi:hypothetical protein